MLKKQEKRYNGDGTIYQRADGRYEVKIMIDGKRVARYTNNPKEAEKIRRQLALKAEQGKLITVPQQTLKEHLTQWLEVKRVDWRPATYRFHRDAIDLTINPALGHVKLNKLTPDKIQTFYADLTQNKRPPNFIRKMHGILKRALKAAVKWKKLQENPCNFVDPPRAVKTTITFLDEQEARRLIEAAQGHELFECLIPLALATGMRRGELLALTWDDIDFEQKLLHVKRSVTVERDYEHQRFQLRVDEPKTENSKRTILLPDFALEFLQTQRKRYLAIRLRAKKWEEHNLVFPTRGGSHIWPHGVSLRIKSLIKKAGLPDMRFHDLRHSAATILLAMGVPANVVQERLGHSDVRITLGIYGHVTKKMKTQAVHLLDEIFNAENELEQNVL